MKSIDAFDINKAWLCLAEKMKLKLDLSEVVGLSPHLQVVLPFKRAGNSVSLGFLSICRGGVKQPLP